MSTLAALLLVVGFAALALGLIGLVREWRSPSTTSALATWCLPLAVFCGWLAALIELAAK